MTVTLALDTSALVVILRREPEADAFLGHLAANKAALSAVNLLETSLVLAGRTGDAATWTDLDALLLRAAVEIIPHDADLTDLARRALLTYGEGRHPAALNFGDCAAYALAKSRGLPLLFKGDDFSRTDIVSARQRPRDR